VREIDGGNEIFVVHSYYFSKVSSKVMLYSKLSSKPMRICERGR